MIARFKLDPKGVFIHPHGNASELIRRGAIRLGKEWREKYGINVRWDFRHPAGIPVFSDVVMINGQHYRAAANRSRIRIHSGFNPATGKYSDTFWAKDKTAFENQIAQILWHEWCHTQGFRYPAPDTAHSNYPTDLMHSNAPRTLVDTKNHFLRFFGSLNQRQTVPRTFEAEAVAKITDCQCFSVDL